MHFGGAIFFTDYLMSAPALARALEERGFESSGRPSMRISRCRARRPFLGGGGLPKRYYDATDPFVLLAAVGAAYRTMPDPYGWSPLAISLEAARCSQESPGCGGPVSKVVPIDL